MMMLPMLLRLFLLLLDVEVAQHDVRIDKEVILLLFVRSYYWYEEPQST